MWTSAVAAAWTWLATFGRAAPAQAAAAPRQASGVKVGEITPHSVIVWARLTAESERNSSDGHLVVEGKSKATTTTPDIPVPALLAGACPGAPGRIRVRYSVKEDLSSPVVSDWVAVSEVTDYSCQFSLSDLKPDTPYFYATETAATAGGPPHGALHGRFQTAPSPTVPGNFRFCVMTCQMYSDRDHADGHPIYPSMLQLAPRFLVCTGDNVYYDNEEPRAVNVELARFHWQRMFSLPRLVEFYRNVGCYFEKDDHDTLKNDSWPGQSLGELQFMEGQAIFRQQVPVDGKPFRSFRWGRDLEIWLTDGRDYRSGNNLPDGPQKTIWGTEQKEWLKRTLKESAATWKVLISPTPIVGPDRGAKNDNHANSGFQYEGDEIRSWFKENVPDNFVIICGDRHWQYHSIDPVSGVEEFSVGPASDSHAAGSPGEEPRYHKFHRVKGGFLSVEMQREDGNSRLVLQHHAVDGAVVHRVEKSRPAT